MTTLVICEKNIAAQRIASILSGGSYKKDFVNKVPVYRFGSGGKDYAVTGLRGHILGLDYPKDLQRWDLGTLKRLIETDPVKVPTAHWIVSALNVLSKEADEIIIATDYDREGELIGAEALEVMDGRRASIMRAKFSALTGPEVKHAFENLVKLDINLAKAAETRQVIDLAWGATLTRFISVSTGQTGKDFLSVGRVQSPTLALVVDREKEIVNFVPKPFWELQAELVKDKGFLARHAHGVFWEKDTMSEIFGRLRGAKSAEVQEVQIEEKDEYPPIPFNTTQFLSEANRMGISAPRAMSIAESL
ncbi:MAG: DNA topoisomerase, partial [Candidatus Dadabacteria bacterium]|nr:DNA topoisomerase [Candidatus Dadabacteria bacterium]